MCELCQLLEGAGAAPIGQEYAELPAKTFENSVDAEAFMQVLRQLDISYMVQFDRPPKRLKLPPRTVVVLLGVGDYNDTRH